MRIALESVRAAALLLIGVLAAPAAALTLAPMTLDQMTAAADFVVRARCIDRTPARTPAGSIESVARFEVLEVVKGQPPTVVSVRELGGAIDGTETVVPGAPLSKSNDEVVLFLEPATSGNMQVVGLALGYLPVIEAPPSGRVVRVSPGLGAGFEKGGVRPVSDFLQRVRTLAEAPR